MGTDPSVKVRFGIFEIDVAAGEVRKAGLKIRLQDQPFQVLAVLLERPGEVVTREELRQRLWNKDTFVDFDHSLNTAINKLRDALGDGAENPRYVETVPKRGYRFVAPVEQLRPVEQPRSEPPEPPAKAPRRAAPPAQVLLIGALLVSAGVIIAMWWSMRKQEVANRPSVERFAYSPAGGAGSPVISPDGKHISYVSGTGEQGRVWIQDLDQFEPREVNRSAGAQEYTFWSPDSKQVVFAAKNQLWSVPAVGGDPTLICEIPDGYVGGTWNPNGASIVFGVLRTGLYEVPARGGAAKLFLKFDPGQWNHFEQPQFLPPPHSSLLLITAQARTGQHMTLLHSRSSGRQQVVSEFGNATYSRSGHLLCPRGNLLWAVPFSPEQMKPTGDGFPIAHTLLTRAVTVSSNGTLVYQGGQLPWRLRWRDRRGVALDEVLQESTAWIGEIALSQDGGKVAVTLWDRKQLSLRTWDFARRIKGIITSGDGMAPAWHPAGKMVAFSSSLRGNFDIYLQQLDDNRPATVLAAGPLDEYPEDWSADGKVLVYHVTRQDGGMELWYLQQKNDGRSYEPKPLLHATGPKAAGSISPDGKFLAYQARQSGRPEIYVERFPEGGGRQQVSSGGGVQARWRRDGRELFYLAGDTLMRVSVTTTPAFSAARAEVLFREPNIDYQDPDGAWRMFEPSPDGQRFLVAAPDEPNHIQIRVVQNWFEEFRPHPSQR